MFIIVLNVYTKTLNNDIEQRQHTSRILYKTFGAYHDRHHVQWTILPRFLVTQVCVLLGFLMAWFVNFVIGESDGQLHSCELADPYLVPTNLRCCYLHHHRSSLVNMMSTVSWSRVCCFLNFVQRVCTSAHLSAKALHMAVNTTTARSTPHIPGYRIITHYHRDNGLSWIIIAFTRDS